MKHCVRWLYLGFFSLLVSLPTSLRAQADPFPIPPGLEKQVAFWQRIFTEHSYSQLIFFDPQDMGTIYEVMEVGEDNRSNEYINGEKTRIAAANGVSIDRVHAQRGIREKTVAALKRSGRHIAQMQQIFRERGLPVEITYLPLIESSFEINVRSHMGALGMWQFMPATAKDFKMRVGNAIDERRDPIESTRAAASYLKQAYESLGSWPLAITSYNYGPTGMARAAAEVGTTDLAEIIRNYNGPYWGFAPKNFYAEFLVAVDIGRNIDKYFPGLVLDAPTPIKEVALENNTSLAALVKASAMSQEDLLAWNPALTRQTGWIHAGYRVKLPLDATLEPIDEVVQYQPRVTSARAKGRAQPQAAKLVRHHVRPGESIGQIAQRYGASVQRILQANGLRQGNLVRVGSTLVIPRA